MITINTLFKNIRSELGFNQTKMAGAMGLKKKGTISDYELGKNIPLDKMYRMLAVYEFLGENDQYLNMLNTNIEKEIKDIKSNITITKRRY